MSLTGNEILDISMIVFAEYLSYLIPPLLVWMWLKDGDYRYTAFFAFFTVILSIIFSMILSWLYFYPRPFMLYDTLLSRIPQNSFPSQHAATMFPLAFTMLYKNYRKIGVILLGIAFLNSFARIYVGFHFPIDIIASIMLFIPAIILTTILENLINKFTDITTRIELIFVENIPYSKYYVELKEVLSRYT